MQNQLYSFRDGANIFRFIGRDGSMGYRAGKVYHLGIIWHKPKPGETTSTGMTIYRIRRNPIRTLFGLQIGDRYCDYDTQEAFFDNWEVVR